MFEKTNQYYKKLDDNLALKSVSSMEDIKRLMDFHLIVFEDEPSVARLLKALVLDHPYTKPEYFLFIEDENSKTIVSSLCLIPWIIEFKGVKLRSAEMGIVGTLKEYRKRGLIRLLHERFRELAVQEKFYLTQIEGIPYFYKQFGYEYAIPLEPSYILDLNLIPETLSKEQQEYQFRKATMEDIPKLVELYDKMTDNLEIKSLRSEQVWEYILGPSLEFDPTLEIWLVLDKSKNISGYFRATQEGFSEGLILNEAIYFSDDITIVILKKLKDLCLKHEKPYLRFNNHEDNILVKVVKNLGAKDLGHYAWQIYFFDKIQFLNKIKSILEQRILESPFKGLTETVFIDMYHESIELKIEKGEIKEIKIVQSQGETSHFRIPPNLVVPFFLGYRNREDLIQYNHDVRCLQEQRWEKLIDILFPKMSSFLYLNF